MSQLSAQSIIARCKTRKRVIAAPSWFWKTVDKPPMIEPFFEDRLVVHGRTAGLGPATYDFRLAEDIHLGVNPANLIADFVISHGLWSALWNWRTLRQKLKDNPPWGAIAHTIERLHMPDDVSAEVLDKSTYARWLVTHFNTFIDPGFNGDLVIEIVNLGFEPRVVEAGTPICQIKFTHLDQPTDRPYAGRYQGQRGAQGAILENGAGLDHRLQSDTSAGRREAPASQGIDAT